MFEGISVFMKAKAVISRYKNSKIRLELLRFSGKTPASPGQGGNIMAQIAVLGVSHLRQSLGRLI